MEALGSAIPGSLSGPRLLGKITGAKSGVRVFVSSRHSEAVSTPTETGDSSLLFFLCNRSSVNSLCRQGRREWGGTSVY